MLKADLKELISCMWIQKIKQNMRDLIEPNCNAILEHILYVPLFGIKLKLKSWKKQKRI